MNYMQRGGFQHRPLMRWTLILTSVLLIAFWITNLGIYFSKMSIDPDSVISYYVTLQLQLAVLLGSLGWFLWRAPRNDRSVLVDHEQT